MLIKQGPKYRKWEKDKKRLNNEISQKAAWLMGSYPHCGLYIVHKAAIFGAAVLPKLFIVSESITGVKLRRLRACTPSVFTNLSNPLIHE